MNINDPRIGKRGEHKPTQTVSGLPVPPVFSTVTGIDDNNTYYCVIDTFPQVDVTATLEELKKVITSGSKRTSAKTSEES